jgi:hypothetical protein
MTTVNQDGSIQGVDEIKGAQVSLSIPVGEGLVEEPNKTLFDCVEEFRHFAKQPDIYVYTVELYGGRTFLVDDADKTVKEVTAEPVVRRPTASTGYSAERAEKASRAALNYEGDSTEESISNLLADLRHLCEESRYDFAELDEIGRRDYEAQRGDEAP